VRSAGLNMSLDLGRIIAIVLTILAVGGILLLRFRGGSEPEQPKSNQPPPKK